MEKLLIVEENEDTYFTVIKYLSEDAGDIQVFAAHDLDEGLAIARERTPDCIIIDLMLCCLGDCGRLEEYRKLAPGSHLPIIALTEAKLDEASRMAALDAGVDAFVPLPVDRAGLLSQVRLVLRLRSLERARFSDAGAELARFAASERRLRQERDQLATLLDNCEAITVGDQRHFMNGLRAISDLFGIRMRLPANEAESAALLDVKCRIDALILMYREVFGAPPPHGEPVRIDLGGFALELGLYLRDILLAMPDRVDIRQSGTGIMVAAESAVPLCLILEEALANALTHAFPGDRKGSISISVAPYGDQQVECRIVDDGIGLSRREAGPDVRGPGLDLIRILTAQLGGEALIGTAGGFTVIIRIPLSMAVPAQVS